MDINTATQLIQTMGFPIFCCVALGFFVYTVWKKQSADNAANMDRIVQSAKEREDKLYEQIDKFSASLNNFNSTLVKIDTRLEMLEKMLNK